jgi:hypothetical protein
LLKKSDLAEKGVEGGAIKILNESSSKKWEGNLKKTSVLEKCLSFSPEQKPEQFCEPSESLPARAILPLLSRCSGRRLFLFSTSSPEGCWGCLSRMRKRRSVMRNNSQWNISILDAPCLRK